MRSRMIHLVSLALMLSLANNASSQPSGEILIEWWLNISGNAVTDLTGNANFPDNPSGSGTLNTLELPRTKPPELSELNDNYGARLQGNIYPPASGDYTFWITGDNGSQFWLSTDADPANVVMMCEVPNTQWTDAREWTKFPNDQKSVTVTLKGGRAYYFDVLMQEGSGGDGVAVGWGGPTIGAGPIVIEGQYLSFPTGPNLFIALDPNPADGETDVWRDVVLSWTPGEYAAAVNGHTVYFSDSYGDVNDGIGGVALSAPGYAPGRLAFDTTYYWRVDEINAPPDSTVHPGRVWSFTTEPIGYPVDGTNITATASSSGQVNLGPENTINGSGLDADDLHSTVADDMWLSGNEPAGTWVQYEFDKLYKLHEMWVWNSNQSFEALFGFGMKDVTVEYSTNGTDWTALADVPPFTRAPGAAGYAHDTTVDFGGVAARFVKLTATSNWGGILPQYGLSEVRFFSIPASARKPSPETGAADVAVDGTLSWRQGREAGTHNVYVSTDQQAVIDATAPVVSVPDASYSASLDLASTYYWRVDEVNDIETTTTWQGDVWDFTTQEYIVVEDFEDYNDYPPYEIYTTWVDGYEIPANGSQVGNLSPPLAETTIVHSGNQSMPLFYSNTGGASFSEGKRTFAAPQNWARHNIKTLSLFFFGTLGNTGQLYVKINDTKIPYDGQTANLTRAGWQPWNIDLTVSGANLQSVNSLTLGVDGNGASGTLYFDDIRLYAYEREFITPVVPDDTALIGYWTFDGNLQDASGKGNHGTAGGDPTYVAGQTGQALDLDGSDYVVIDGLADDITTTTFTVSAWIKTTQTSAGNVVASNDAAGTNHEFIIGVDQGQVLVEADSINLYPPAVNDNQWHFIAYARDGDIASIYVDGFLVGTETPSGNVVSQGRWSIGQEWDSANNTSPSDFYTGQVDEVRVYNYALSHAEAASLAGRTEPFEKPF